MTQVLAKELGEDGVHVNAIAPGVIGTEATKGAVPQMMQDMLVWSGDLRRARELARGLQAGTVWINDFGSVSANGPFGGFKQSGLGRELNIDGAYEYTELKHIYTALDQDLDRRDTPSSAGTGTDDRHPRPQGCRRSSLRPATPLSSIPATWSHDMDFALTEEQELFRATLEGFGRKELRATYIERAKEHGFPWETWRLLARNELLGLPFAPDLGGQGADAVTLGVACEELARHDFNAGMLMFWSGIIYALEYLPEPLRSEVIRGVTAGERVVAGAITEPDAGSDTAAMRTTLRRDGTGYRLSGEKTSVSVVEPATDFLVWCRFEDGDAIGLLWVPGDAPGISRGIFRDTGARALTRGWVHFDDVAVTDDQILRPAGAGYRQLMENFDYSRCCLALLTIGAAEASIEETCEYVKQRSAFGQPLARWEGVSFQLAEHATLLAAARLLCYEGLWRHDRGLPFAKEAAMAKWWAPQVAFAAIQRCLVLHGHYGYSDELPFEQRMRDVLANQLADGTAEIMKIIVAREMLGREYLPYTRQPARAPEESA